MRSKAGCISANTTSNLEMSPALWKCQKWVVGCVGAPFRHEHIKMTLHNLWLRRLLSSSHFRNPLPTPADMLNIEWGQNFCLEPLLSSSTSITSVRTHTGAAISTRSCNAQAATRGCGGASCQEACSHAPFHSNVLALLRWSFSGSFLQNHQSRSKDSPSLLSDLC